MLIRIKNETLIDKREHTIVSSPVSVSATTLTVIDNSNLLTDNDYFILGKIGSEGSEILQINGAGAVGTSITFDRNGGAGGARFVHGINTPVYRVDYNQIRIAHSTSQSTADIDNANVQTLDVQPDDTYTRYEDTSYTTGYYFIRFYNQTTGQFSDYSAPIPVTGHVPRSLWEIARRVYRELGLLINDDMDERKIKFIEVRRTINDKQRDVFHDRLWTFAESEKSFSTVANQFLYSFASDLNHVNSVVVDSRPLEYMDRATWEMYNWNTTSTNQPSSFNIWNNQLYLSPTPSGSADTTTLGAAITTTTATTITVVSTSGFRFAPFARFIIDSEVIYATGSTTTTFTGCLRGQEGTTAATHLIAATVTERDGVYTFQVEPDDLVDISDLTAIPEPEGLAFGAAMELALGSLKDTSLHNSLKAKYDEWYGKLKNKYSRKTTSGFGRVKDMRWSKQSVLRDPNDYPTGLS